MKTLTGIFLMALLSYQYSVWASDTDMDEVPGNRGALAKIYHDVQRTDLLGAKAPSIWFIQRFVDAGKQKYGVFGKQEFSGIHPEGAVIGAAIYVWNDHAWQLETANPDIASVGVYGEAPDTDHVRVLQLASDALAFVFEIRDGKMGYGNHYAKIVAYQGGEFSDAGELALGEDNAGNCDDNPAREKRGKHGIACWSYSGTVSVASTGSGKFHDLIVTRKGSIGYPHLDDASQIQSLNKRVLYQYRDDSYQTDDSDE